MLLRAKAGRAKRGGVTVVEMAFVLGIALLLLFGIIEYARFVFFLHVSQNAAREGARFAVVRTGLVLTPADVNTIKGNMTDMATHVAGTPKWATGSTIRGVVNASMSNQQNMLLPGTYNVEAYATNASTGAPVNGTVASSPWSEQPFGGSVCVQITGTYRWYAAALLHITNSDMAINVKEFMASEAN
jgi:Flp pilus assembly protein TadG